MTDEDYLLEVREYSLKKTGVTGDDQGGGTDIYLLAEKKIAY